jgi:hypothetical protein
MDLEEALVPLGFFAMVAYISKLIGETRIRRKVLDEQASPEVADSLLASRRSEPSALSSLKWGLVVLALGVSIIFIEAIGLAFESPLAYGFVMLSAGIGLLGHYLIARDDLQNQSTASASSPAAGAGTRHYAAPRDSARERHREEQPPGEETESDVPRSGTA